MKFLLILFVVISLSACGEYGVEPNQVAPETEQIFADNLDTEPAAACIETQSYWDHNNELMLKVDMNCLKPIITEKVELLLGCGESEQPLNENEESAVNDIVFINPNGIKVVVNDRVKDHEDVAQRLASSYIERGLRELEYEKVEK